MKSWGDVAGGVASVNPTGKLAIIDLASDECLLYPGDVASSRKVGFDASECPYLTHMMRAVHGMSISTVPCGQEVTHVPWWNPDEHSWLWHMNLHQPLQNAS